MQTKLSIIGAGSGAFHIDDGSAGRTNQAKHVTCRRWFCGRDVWLEVDGGVKVDNIADVARAGADTFVAGSAIYGTKDYRATIAAMRAELAKAGG